MKRRRKFKVKRVKREGEEGGRWKEPKREITRRKKAQEGEESGGRKEVGGGQCETIKKI